MTRTPNKLTAPLGTLADVPSCDVTAWNLAGWTFVRYTRTGWAELRKVR